MAVSGNPEELSQLSGSLERSDEQFFLLAEAMPHMVWSARPDGRIDYVNRRWIDYTGFGVHAVRGRNAKGIVHPDELDLTWKRWDEALKTGLSYEIEYRLRANSDGSYRWFIGRAAPVRDEDGRILRWIGTATDIDAQKRLSESLKFVFDASNAFSSSLDVDEIVRIYAQLSIQQFADWCFVVLRNERGQLHTSAIEHRNRDLVGYVEQFRDRYPAGDEGVLGQVLRTGQPVLIPTISEEQVLNSARDAQHAEILRRLAMHSAMAVPLSWEGITYGAVILVSSESKRTFDDRDLEVAGMVAARAALSIQNATMFGRERRTAQRLRFITKAAEALFETLDVQETFDRLARLVVPDVADFSVIAAVEPDNQLRVVSVKHKDPKLDAVAREFIGQRPLRRESEIALVNRLADREPILSNAAAAERLTATVRPYLLDTLLKFGITSTVQIPLYGRDRQHGALVCYYTDSGRSYAEDDLPMLVELARRTTIAIENSQTFERERRIAATLQDLLLPGVMPVGSDVHLDAVYAPSKNEAQVGGDWYDAFTLDDGSVVLTVGDVTGRGVQAASIMSKVRHAISVLPLHERDPARILDGANQILRRRYQDIIVTAFVGIIDPNRRAIRFANAGHPYPLLRKNGKLVELQSGGLPLGLRQESTRADSVEESLEGAELLTLYTDGLVESTHDILAGEKRVRDLLLTDAVLHARHPAKMLQEVCLFDGAPDDVAILTLSFKTTKRWSFESENARAAQDARSEFVTYLRGRAADPDAIAASELIFGELIGNVARHAPGRIEIDVDWSGKYPVLHIIDSGAPFVAQGGALPHDVLSENGRGLFIVRELARSLRIEPVARYGNHISAELPVAAG